MRPGRPIASRRRFRCTGLIPPALACLPGVLYADNLGVLAFPLLFWPAELVLCIVFIAFNVYLVRRISRGECGRTQMLAGILMAALAVVAASLFPGLVMSNVLAARSREIVLVTVVPVILLAAICVCAACAVIVKAIRGR
jgi:hypothetical protein